MDLKWNSTYQSFAVALVKAGVPKPEVGYEFMDGDRIVGEAELAWPDYRLCILCKHQRDDEPAIRKLGWTVWDLSPYENDKGSPSNRKVRIGRNCGREHWRGGCECRRLRCRTPFWRPLNVFPDRNSAEPGR